MVRILLKKIDRILLFVGIKTLAFIICLMSEWLHVLRRTHWNSFISCVLTRERERKTEKFRNRSNSEHLYCVFISNFMPISTSIAITSDYLQFSTLFKLSFFSLLAFYIWIEACENIILLSDCIGTCRKSFFLSFSSFRWNPVSLKF